MRQVGSRYVLEERIGSGGMGEVWRGRAVADNDVVAVKILHQNLTSDAENVERFLRERRVLMEVASPNVVKVHDLVVEGSTLAIVMEFVDGGDLRSFSTAAGGLGGEQALELVIGLAEGVRAIHLNGVIHRDIKPQNVLVDASGGRLVAKVGDFGIARVVADNHITQHGHLMGTPTYMAPETLQELPATTSTDLYAVGCVLYEVIAGRPPFVGTQASIMQQHINAQPPPLPGIVPALWALIARLLDKNPAVRPSASETVAVLRDLMVATPLVEAADDTTQRDHVPWWLPPFVARSNEVMARSTPVQPVAPSDCEWWKQ